MNSLRADIAFAVWFLVVAAIVYFRLLRPVRLRASSLWRGPAIFVVLTLLLVWGSYSPNVPIVAVVLAVVAGGLLGIPFGLLRGMHTRVRTTENPKVLIVEPSFIPLAIWFGAFVARFAVKLLLPHAGAVAITASDGLIAFAVGSVIGARWVIGQKFREQRAT